MHNAFFTLDVRGWKEQEAEQPRETWAQIEARLKAEGKEDSEISIIRVEWEDHVKREQKRLKRKGAKGVESAPAAADAAEEEGGVEVEKEEEEWALPAESMRTLHVGEWTPLQLGREPPEARRSARSYSEHGHREHSRSEHSRSAPSQSEHSWGASPQRRTSAAGMRAVPRWLSPHMCMRDICEIRARCMRGACETAPICAQARFGHCIAKCDQTLYMYGGRTMGGAIESFMQFDARPLVWRSVPADGDTPGSRVSHRTLLIGHYMYVLGGGSGSRSFNDLRRLDLYTMRWELMPTRGEARPPPPPATPPLHMGVLGMQLGRAARVCHACRARATSRTRSSARRSSTWSRTWSSSAAATGGGPPTTCTLST